MDYKYYIIILVTVSAFSMSVGAIIGASYQFSSDENLIHDIAESGKVLKTSKDSYSIRLYRINDINESMIQEANSRCTT